MSKSGTKLVSSQWDCARAAHPSHWRRWANEIPTSERSTTTWLRPPFQPWSRDIASRPEPPAVWPTIRCVRLSMGTMTMHASSGCRDSSMRSLGGSHSSRNSELSAWSRPCTKTLNRVQREKFVHAWRCRWGGVASLGGRNGDGTARSASRSTDSTVIWKSLQSPREIGALLREPATSAAPCRRLRGVGAAAEQQSKRCLHKCALRAGGCGRR